MADCVAGYLETCPFSEKCQGLVRATQSPADTLVFAAPGVSGEHRRTLCHYSQMTDKAAVANRSGNPHFALGLENGNVSA